MDDENLKRFPTVRLFCAGRYEQSVINFRSACGRHGATVLAVFKAPFRVGTGHQLGEHWYVAYEHTEDIDGEILT